MAKKKKSKRIEDHHGEKGGRESWKIKKWKMKKKRKTERVILEKKNREENGRTLGSPGKMLCRPRTGKHKGPPEKTGENEREKGVAVWSGDQNHERGCAGQKRESHTSYSLFKKGAKKKERLQIQVKGDGRKKKGERARESTKKKEEKEKIEESGSVRRAGRKGEKEGARKEKCEAN